MNLTNAEINNKVYLVFDKTKKALKIKSNLNKKIQTTSLKKCNIIVVVGVMDLCFKH